MNLIDFAEKRGEEAAKFSLATLDVNRARAHNLLTLLLGGAGAVLVWALAQPAARNWALAVAAVVAVWWFVLAAWLAVHALRTNEVRTWAGHGARILRKGAEWQTYAREVIAEGKEPVDPLYLLREQELENMAEAAAEYRAASCQCASALDRVYLLAACTPVPALAAWLAYRFLG